MVRRLAASTLATLAVCLALSACKPAADDDQGGQPSQKAPHQSPGPAKAEATLIQQAANSCRQRIQEAARDHAANARQLQEAKVLDMEEVKQREQLETKRAVVRKFLASNETFKSLLVNEEAVFKEELAKLNMSQARIDSAVKAYQSGIRGKALTIQMRDADQRIGGSLLSALDFLDEIWGQWNYNKEYGQVQFSPPGALKRYNDFMDAVEAASKEQQELQEQLKAAGTPGP